MDLTPAERDVLTVLQRGITPLERPFRNLALPEDDAVDFLRRVRGEGLVRRFGGVFDARRLGYRSVLCALDVAPEHIEEKASLIASHPGVTHCYERCPLGRAQRYPSLWFTLAMLDDVFDKGFQTLRKQLGSNRLLLLPAIRRFKIDVVFDLRTRNRDEIVPGTHAFSRLPEQIPQADCFTDRDRDLVRLLDQQLPLSTRPFDPIAQQLDMPLPDLLARLQIWLDEGVLRRIAVILHHLDAGFKANGMCVWPVAGDQVHAGRRLAARPEVTHCYQRPRQPDFPFDLYAMIHTGNWPATRALFEEISAACNLTDGLLFGSYREFKKISMKYFSE